MDPDEVMLDAEERMEKAVDTFHSGLNGWRTGRATPGLVDSIRVDYYGSPTPLKQIATISVPEPQQIVIKPYDQGIAGDPPLSTERRKQLVSRVKELAEEARVAIRNIRRDANKHIDASEKDKAISEDDAKRYKDDVQEMTKKFEGKVNETATAKETEVMEE